MYAFYPHLLLRTPAFSHKAYENIPLQHLVKGTRFRGALFLASRSLYQELEKQDFHLEGMPARALHSLKKYHNRMCFRPTPFGLFSGFSVAAWSGGKDERICLEKELPLAHAAPSFETVQQLAQELLSRELAPCHRYYPNGSLYRVQGEYRYLRCEQEGGTGTRRFFLDAVTSQPLLRSVLRYCRKPQTREAIIAHVREQTGAAESECAAFFGQLVAQQLLVSTLEANITGEAYERRLLRMSRAAAPDAPGTRRLARLLATLEADATGGSGAGIAGLLLRPEAAAAEGMPGRSPWYVNLEKSGVSGGLPSGVQHELLEGLECLHRLVPAGQPAGLEHFRRAFTRKFDRRAVPLLVALDPEHGVGYEELATRSQTPKLLQDVAFPPAGKAAPLLEWSPVHALLLDKWRAVSGMPGVLRLEEQELEGLLPAGEDGVLPPSTSVLFRLVDGQVYVEQAGGVSATALLGRFTPLNQQVQALAESVARQEQAANPGVLFAEVAHLSDGHTANIDRRRAVRPYEIPVLVQPGVEEDGHIPLSDLMVQVVEDRIVLWSQRLRKQIVPRLSSAFNYSRDDLAAFRFLCDLQYQGLKANFTLDLASFFPDLGFYPRVEYKNTILSLATWYLKKDRWEHVFNAPAGERFSRVRKMGQALGWPRYLAITRHDHQLVVDLEKEEEVAFLLDNARQEATLVLKEFPFAEEQHPVVTDAQRRPYVHQFLAAVFHEKEVYPPVRLQAPRLSKAAERKRKLLPGSGWLYVKVYCHPARANQLLTDHLFPLLDRLARRGEVEQWFYVRYRDPDYHLRVRLQVAGSETGKLPAALMARLQQLVRQGTVQDVQLAVYERELERYGPELIEAVEAAFCASSALAAGFLRKTGLPESGYGYFGMAFVTVDRMLTALGLDLEGKAGLLESLSQAFYQEFGQGKELREQLNDKYREISRQEHLLPGSPEDPPFLQFPGSRKRQAAFARALEAVAAKAGALAEEQQRQLFGDLVHMHLNRLLVDDARKQELVLYYCLWKHYRSVQARAKASGGS